MRFLREAGLLAICALVASAETQATGQRSFVASDGTAGTCKRANPCRTFDDAIAQTDPGGEVVVLDSAGYGPTTITKSISLIAPPGVYAGITVKVGAGITISAANTDDVILRGLTINGQGGTDGIVINSARSVSVENVVVSGMTGPSGVGIYFHPNDAMVLSVTASVLRDNNIGLSALPAPGGNAALSRLTVQRTEFLGNGAGLQIFNIDRTSVTDSTFTGPLPLAYWGIRTGADANAAGNTSVAIERTTVVGYDIGVAALGFSGKIGVVNLAHSAIAGNSIGVQAIDGGYVRLTDNQIDGNGTGTFTLGTGIIASLGNNLRHGNTTEGVAATSLTPY